MNFLLHIFLISFINAIPFNASSPSSSTAPSHIYENHPAEEDDYLSFLVIGDWGEPNHLKSESLNAEAMNSVAASSQSSFVVAVGDNFYDAGVTGSNDQKFKTLWESVYDGAAIKNLTWYVVMGNHDWYGNQNGQIQFSTQNPRWVMPDFFYTKTFTAGSKKVAFLFIDTDLLHYGYEGTGEVTAPGNQLVSNFHAQGWAKSSNTLEQQLEWIDKHLSKHARNSDYIFVAGHHDLVTCNNQAPGMLRLQELLEKYKVSAYFFGHRHALGASKVNNVIYVQSGAGGKKEAACSGPGVWGQGDIFGFASITISGKSFTADFIRDDGEKLYSLSGSSRLI